MAGYPREYHAGMGSDRQEALISRLAVEARPERRPWSPAARAMLWMDAVLLVAAGLAIAGMPPALGYGASVWTWSALGGATLTALLAAFAAFEMTVPGRSRAWAFLPAPAFVLWIVASGVGCLALPGGADAWGDTLAEAGQCLRFLLMISLPLLALMLVMLWRSAPLVTPGVLAMGAIASAGAAAGLLGLVHPHDASLLDLGAHAVALAIVLGIGAFAQTWYSAGRRISSQ